jgi:Mg-chelatase subunit ChlD
MDKSEEKTGIQISPKSSTGISIVGGGIKILASGKPVTASFVPQWGQVYIILDCSGSMKGQKIEQSKQGILEFAQDAFIKNYRVGFIKFSSKAEMLCEPTDNTGLLEEKTKNLRASGSTKLSAAIKIAHEKLRDFAGTKVMLIATDGMPDNVNKSLNAADDAKVDGIEILTIGTDDADREFLKKLASKSELSAKVSSDMFAQAISDASRLLSTPSGNDKKLSLT